MAYGAGMSCAARFFCLKFSVATLFSPGAHATPNCPEAQPQALTLASAAARALCLDPSLWLARAELARVQAQLDERRGLQAPSFSATVTPAVTLSAKRPTGLDSNTSSANAAFVLNHTVLDGGARAARVTQARDEVQSQQASAVSTHQDAQRDFVALWADTLDAQTTLASAQAAVQSARASAEVAQARLRAGAATQVELLQGAAAQTRAARDWLGAKTQWAQQMGKLAQRLGWSAATALRLLDDNSQAQLREPGVFAQRGEAAPSSAAQQMSLWVELEQRHPQLIAQRAKVAAQAAAVQAARADGKATLVLTAQSGPGWSRSNVGTVNTQTLTSSQWTTSANLNWNWTFSDGGAREARVAQALAQLEVQQAQQEALQRSLSEQLWQRLTLWRDSQAQLVASESALQASAQAEAAQLGRYRAGLGTLTELLTAQSDLAQSRNQAHQAEHQRLRQGAGLLHALGMLALVPPPSLAPP